VDVCRALKTNPQPPRVILITGNAFAAEVDACGADAVMPKPFRPAELAAEVEGMLAAPSLSARPDR
jgi:CheY-like chemotaxis protein